jgi:ABC-type phosphate transport system substrate-binding protein
MKLDSRAVSVVGGTTLAMAIACSTGALATTSNDVTLNGGGATAGGPVYESVFSAVGLNAVPSANGASTCPANGSTKPYDVFYGFVGTGAGATGFINNDSTQIGCQGGGLPDDYGTGDSPIASNYTNGSQTFLNTYGYQLIQVPAFATPVTIPFNLPLKKPKNGSINLTDSQLCQIFSGTLNNWSSIANSGSTSPIAVAYRQDSSGQSFLLTNHLGAVCGSVNTSGITFSGTSKFATLFPGYTTTVVNGVKYYTVPAGTFAKDISAAGSGGVELNIDSTSNSIGYLSPDYTRIAPTPTLDQNGKAPYVAEVNAILPSLKEIQAALKTFSTTGTSATDPDSFGFLDPVPTAGYPIVGYAYVWVSSCYATAAKTTVVKTWLDGLYNVSGTETAAYNAIIAGGLAPLPGVTASAAPTALAKTIVKDYLATKPTVAIRYDGQTGCTGGR